LNERDAGVVAADVLERLRAHPFYAAYKQRTFELLELHAHGRYLDVGAGTGGDAHEHALASGSTWVAVDRSIAMAHRARAIAADARALPFPAETFDGCRADRVLQYLPDASDAIAEMARVTRAGGRVVVADPDYDTQVVEVDDQDLARRVRTFRRDAARGNGAFAHRALGAFRNAGLVDVEVEARTLVVRDPTDVDNVMGLADWAHFAAELGSLKPDEPARWRNQLAAAAREGRFLYAVTFFLTAGRRP
jgi:SAM-dependent methyltransferase